jgi:hypothetical protein
LISVKVSCNDHKYSILSKSPSLKVSGIFINEDPILEDQDELRKGVQKVKEARKERKWTIIRNRKAIIRDRDRKDNINRNLGHLGSFFGTVVTFHGTKVLC